MTIDECLILAWKAQAPMAATSTGFPRGFWPDVARHAALMFEQQTMTPDLGDFRPCRCDTGNGPQPTQRSSPKSSGGISKATKAANTAALLALLENKA